MDRLAIVRSVNHGTGDHTKGNHWMLTGYEGPAFNAPDNQVQRRPVDRLGGGPAQGHRRPGLPPYIAVPNLRGGTDNLFHYAAYLGGYANPFVADSDPNDPEFRVKNLTLPGNVSLSRLEDRRRILEAMEQIRRAGDLARPRPRCLLPTRV